MMLYCNGKTIDLQNGNVEIPSIVLTPSPCNYYYESSPNYYPVNGTTITKVNGTGTVYELPSNIAGYGFHITVSGAGTSHLLYCEDENGNVINDGVFESTPTSIGNNKFETHIFFTKNTAKRMVIGGNHEESLVSFDYDGESTIFTPPTSHSNQGGALLSERKIRRIESNKWYIVPYDVKSDTGVAFKWCYCPSDDLSQSIEKTVDWLGLYTDLMGSGVFYATDNGWAFTSNNNASLNVPIIEAKRFCIFIGDSFAMNQSQIAGKMCVNGIATKTFSRSGGTAEDLNGNIFSACGKSEYKSWDTYLDEHLSKFTDIIIELGMNVMTSDYGVEWDSYRPKAVGNVYDLMNGKYVTVNGQTISTISAYYNLFAKNTYGQKAFMIEMLQAYIRKHGLKTNLWLLNYGHCGTRYGSETIDKVERCAWNDKVNAQLSSDYGVRVIPVYGLGILNYEENTYDGTHPNWKGSKLYADAIAEALYKI